MSTLTPEQEGPQDQGVPASPSGCQPSASDLRSSRSGIPNAAYLIDEIASHLGAAISQALPSDDHIIMGHVRSAHVLAMALRRAA